jgi:hypothetical protein
MKCSVKIITESTSLARAATRKGKRGDTYGVELGFGGGLKDTADDGTVGNSSVWRLVRRERLQDVLQRVLGRRR